VDWEKVGQAFQGGANVLAGGLMDKYQRKRGLEDWEQKQRLASQIQAGEREQEHAFQFGKQTREFTLEGIKNDLKTNPELIPYAIKAEQGDEEATRILSIYAGAKYQMDQKTPLTSDDLALLKDLPPQTRHVIINRHLTTLNEESKRQADLEGVLARTEREKVTTQKAREDMQDNSDLYGGYAAMQAGREQAETQRDRNIRDATAALAKTEALIEKEGGEPLPMTAKDWTPPTDKLKRLMDHKAELERKLDMLQPVATTQASAAAGANEAVGRVTKAVGKSIPPEVLAAAKKKYPNMSDEEIIRQWQASHK